MLSRFVRTQLIIFAIISVVGVSVLAVRYLQIPAYLGIGHINVTLELPAGGGLYRFANVTYQGVQVGRVTAVDLKSDHQVDATLSLDSSPKIPRDLRAEVRSISAVGEQYVDLKPVANRPPYLQDGSIISMRAATIPQPVGPVLDRASALLDSIPNDNLNDLIGETSRGFGGAGYDLGSLLDSGAALGQDLDGVARNTRELIRDASPLVDSQVSTADDIRTWARSLANVTEQLTTNDPQLRKVLQNTPGFARDVGGLLDQLKPTLPILLANLTTIGQVTLTYNPGLEQLFVLLPPAVAASQSSLPKNNPTGMTLGNFSLELNDPPPCTVGFLPPSEWRSPADTTTIDTPDGIYCKLPQDSPIAVRGARNIPCMDKPGKRAPTVEICNSDQPFEPLAVRPHILGPAPIDPNLISQGIPPDSRVSSGDHLYGPVDGTPPPPGMPPSPQVPTDPPPPESSSAPEPIKPPPTDPLTPGDASPPPAAPSSFQTKPAEGASVSTADYNPRTGSYLGPDDRMYRQTDIAKPGAMSAWEDLMPIT